MDFNDKVVVVTGASSGIGAAIALKFAEKGANVTIVGRNKSKLKDVSMKCEKVGRKPLIITADVCKDEDAKRIVSITVNCYGKIDVLVNNAGINLIAPISDDTVMEKFDRVMNTNFRSCVTLTHFALKYLIESKGNIINISSIAAYSIIGIGNSAYCSSKIALDHFTRSIASELAQQGVRANVINPGPVKTDIIENMGTDAQTAVGVWEYMKNSTALQRISQPEEIAELALFLASDKAVGITGSSIVADNGFLLV